MAKSDDRIREAMRLLGSRMSVAKAASSRANGAKGGRPRKDGRPPQTTMALPTPDATPTRLAPLWERLETFLKANGPSMLRTLRDRVAVTPAERERVKQTLQRRPATFHETPAPTFGEDIWRLR